MGRQAPSIHAGDLTRKRVKNTFSSIMKVPPCSKCRSIVRCSKRNSERNQLNNRPGQQLIKAPPSLNKNQQHGSFLTESRIISDRRQMLLCFVIYFDGIRHPCSPKRIVAKQRLAACTPQLCGQLLPDL